LNPGQPGVPLKAKSLTRAINVALPVLYLAELRALRAAKKRALKKNSGALTASNIGKLEPAI
jgi:hypothetical protein